MLRARDYRAASSFLQRLYACSDPEAFPEFVVRQLHDLVGADQVTWNELAFSVPWARVTAYPRQREPERITRLFAAHMHEHPGIQAWRAGGGAVGTRAISDFLSTREYHHTNLYQQLYRELGYEEQLCPALTPPNGRAVAIAFGRGHRGVSQHDRDMVELLSPHLLQAWLNAQAMARAERALAGHRQVAAALGQCILEIDGHGSPREMPPRALKWLRQYFGDAPLHGAVALPPSLSAWVRHQQRHPVDGGGRPPLISRRGPRQLIVRCFPGDDGGVLLALEERTAAHGARHLQEAGLTRRELEVLVELEAGKTNAEVAADLSIAPATVKKHLDNIYAKLDVRNRTEAVRRLRHAAD